MTISPSFVLILGLLTCYAHGQSHPPTCEERSKTMVNECTPNDECVAVQSSGKKVTCPSDYELIGFEENVNFWYYVETINCVISQTPEGLRVTFLTDLSTEYHILLCRKKKGCDPANFFEFVAYDNIHVVVPDSNFKCPADYKFGVNQYSKNVKINGDQIGGFAGEKNGNAQVMCVKGQLRIQIGKKKPPSIPIQIRCAREYAEGQGGCAINFKEKMSSKCKSEEGCIEVRKQESGGKAKCDPGYVLQCYYKDNKHGQLRHLWSYGSAVNCRSTIISVEWRGKASPCETVDCRKPMRCEPDQYQYKDELADTTYAFAKLEADFKCPKDYSLQYLRKDSSEWKNIEAVECSTEGYAIVREGGVLIDAIPRKFRCAIEKRCNVANDYYYKSECEKDNGCEKPIFRGNGFECRIDFVMQARLMTLSDRKKVNGGAFEYVTATCDSSGLMMMKNTENRLIPDTTAYELRCASLKTIDNFFKDNYCESIEDCAKPKNCEDIKCDAGLSLVLDFGDGKWEEVEKASCEKDIFMGKDGKALSQQPKRVKCARNKCVKCKSPCPTCTGAEFTVSTKWNECAEFTCGPNTRTIIGSKYINTEQKFTCVDADSKATTWNMKDVASSKIASTTTNGDVKCEKLCTLSNPLKGCDSNDPQCEQLVFNDDKTEVCKNSKKMFYQAADKDAIEISDLKCNKITGEWPAKMLKNGQETAIIVPKDSVISCHAGCNIELYYNNGCEANNECEMPVFIAEKLSCKADFGLQVDFGKKDHPEWVDASSAACEKNRFKVEIENTISIRFPYGFRCVRKVLANFYNEITDCDKPKEICDKPLNCTSTICNDKDLAINIKVDQNSPWVKIDSLSCNSDQFIYKENGESKKVANPKGLKCVVKKMICSLCPNPCPTCNPEFHPVFAAPSKWDECAKFECGAGTRTDLTSKGSKLDSGKLVCTEENGAAVWNSDQGVTQIEEVICENLCTLQSPINSTCDKRLTQCDMREPKDYEQITCGKNLFYTFEKIRDELQHIQCNLTTGKWMAEMKQDSTTIVVPAGSNIFCLEGQCDSSRLFPSCDDDKLCIDYKFDGLKYTCPDSADFWFRQRVDENWKLLEDIKELECKVGSIFVNNTRKDYDFQASCRVEGHPTLKQGGLSPGAMIALIIFILLLIVIITATIILRATGNGWLPIIIINKIRGGKGKGLTDKGSKKGSMKSPTPGSTTSRKRTTRNATTKSVVGSTSSRKKSNVKSKV